MINSDSTTRKLRIPSIPPSQATRNPTAHHPPPPQLPTHSALYSSLRLPANCLAPGPQTSHLWDLLSDCTVCQFPYSLPLHPPRSYLLGEKSINPRKKNKLNRSSCHIPHFSAVPLASASPGSVRPQPLPQLQPLHKALPGVPVSTLHPRPPTAQNSIKHWERVGLTIPT